MKQYLILITFCVLISLKLFAQKNNSAQVNIGMMLFTKSNIGLNLNQWGIQYERKINNKLSLSLAYNKWTTWKDKFVPRQDGVVRSKCYSSANPKECEKELVTREHYKMIDLSVLNTIYKRKKIGELKASVGVSYTWGKNTFVDTVILSSSSPFDYIQYEYHYTAGRYFGIVPTINYNYYLWKDRIIIGIHARVRKYFGLKDIQFDSGFHLGYNF